MTQPKGHKPEPLSEADRKAIQTSFHENFQYSSGAGFNEYYSGAAWGIKHARKNMINDNKSLLGLDVAAAVDAELGSQAERIKELEAEVLKLQNKITKRGAKTLTEIGEQFNISPSAVSMIHNRKTWTHV
jgi:DNA-directed RNA polymerase specialized sigma subunit